MKPTAISAHSIEEARTIARSLWGDTAIATESLPSFGPGVFDIWPLRTNDYRPISAATEKWIKLTVVANGSEEAGQIARALWGRGPTIKIASTEVPNVWEIWPVEPEVAGTVNDAPIARAERENRLRIYLVHEKDILDSQYIFDGMWTAFQVGMRPKIPRGAKILSVYYEMCRRAFSFMVCHPSFAPVAPMAAAPVVDAGPFDFECAVMEKEEDGRYRLRIRDKQGHLSDPRPDDEEKELPRRTRQSRWFVNKINPRREKDHRGVSVRSEVDQVR
jgi:hypothetical protein